MKAANNDDVWNESGASIDFAILPAFYQTRLFSILCALAASRWYGASTGSVCSRYAPP